MELYNAGKECGKYKYKLEKYIEIKDWEEQITYFKTLLNSNKILQEDIKFQILKKRFTELAQDVAREAIIEAKDILATYENIL